MIKVTIIGTGNVAHHLKHAFSNSEETELIEVLASRPQTVLEKHISQTKTAKPDIYIIAVSDNAIATVANCLKNTKKIVAHTSGSVAISSLPNAVRKGIFYPLQTFSKERKVNFKSIPICLEADNSKDLEVLKKLAKAISDNVHKINYEQRKTLHLAAVFVNNFSNHLYHIGDQICQKHKLPFKLLQPLIEETALKIEQLSPFDAQTGPAKRNDTETIKLHLNQLKNKKQKDIYSVLTKSIQETYGKKL